MPELVLCLVNNPDQNPPRGTLIVSDEPPRRQSVRRDEHALADAGPMRVDGDLRRSLGRSLAVDGLADDQPPALQTRMFMRRDDVAFYAAEEHVSRSAGCRPSRIAAPGSRTPDWLP